jgi:dTMP kinase
VKGIFLTFEGPDGAGKSTQVRLLSDRLKQSGIAHIATREPGGTPLADQIRALLLNPAHEEMAPMTEVLLYAASRAQHVHEVIRPALEKGWMVICDRYIDASIAYQATGLSLERSLIQRISEEATGFLWPERTFLIDVPPEIGLVRAAGTRPHGLDRIEARGYEYHKRVRETFLALAKEDPVRFCVIDGTRPVEEIHTRIWAEVQDILERAGMS